MLGGLCNDDLSDAFDEILNSDEAVSFDMRGKEIDALIVCNNVTEIMVLNTISKRTR